MFGAKLRLRDELMDWYVYWFGCDSNSEARSPPPGHDVLARSRILACYSVDMQPRAERDDLRKALDRKIELREERIELCKRRKKGFRKSGTNRKIDWLNAVVDRSREEIARLKDRRDEHVVALVEAHHRHIVQGEIQRLDNDIDKGRACLLVMSFAACISTKLRLAKAFRRWLRVPTYTRNVVYREVIAGG